MRVGVVILPARPWSEARPLWQQVEALGLHAGWTYDHLAWTRRPGGPWFGAVPTLAAAAVATTRLRLGLLVASPNLRHPVPLAQDAMSLDDLSGGRFTLGVGAGGRGLDASALVERPWPLRERADRFQEYVTLLDLLLRQPRTTYAGRFYSARDVGLEPGCVQRPRLPLVVAATGPRGMRLAARFGQGWVSVGDPALVRDRVRRLEEACLAAGRDPATIERLAVAGLGSERPLDSLEAFRDAAGRYAEAGVTELAVHHPRDGGEFGRMEVLEAVAADLTPGRSSPE